MVALIIEKQICKMSPSVLQEKQPRGGCWEQVTLREGTQNCPPRHLRLSLSTSDFSPRSWSAWTSHHSPFNILAIIGKKCEHADQRKVSEVKGHDPSLHPISFHAPEQSLDSNRRERTQCKQARPPWRMQLPF